MLHVRRGVHLHHGRNEPSCFRFNGLNFRFRFPVCGDHRKTMMYYKILLTADERRTLRELLRAYKEQGLQLLGEEKLKGMIDRQQINEEIRHIDAMLLKTGARK